MRYVIGLWLASLGAIALLPATRRYAHRSRDRWYRRMPWLQRLPGARVLYSDASQNILATLVGLIFVVVGLLVIAGLVEFR